MWIRFAVRALLCRARNLYSRHPQSAIPYASQTKRKITCKHHTDPAATRHFEGVVRLRNLSFGYGFYSGDGVQLCFSTFPASWQFPVSLQAASSVQTPNTRNLTWQSQNQKGNLAAQLELSYHYVAANSL